MGFSSDVEYAQMNTILKKQKLKKIYNQLNYRKYPNNLLNQAIQQVRNIWQTNLTKTNTQKKTQNNIRLITNYNPRKPQPTPDA